MHSIGDYQDISFMGSLSVYMPFTSSCLMASNFALCGMPFLGWVLFYGTWKCVIPVVCVKTGKGM
jgi:NADH:ubiquinone oxidoreductase subunit 5 (subunit L)/multisubunit Na+/H+ antiporter MnhA subunit